MAIFRQRQYHGRRDDDGKVKSPRARCGIGRLRMYEDLGLAMKKPVR